MSATLKIIQPSLNTQPVMIPPQRPLEAQTLSLVLYPAFQALMEATNGALVGLGSPANSSYLLKTSLGIKNFKNKKRAGKPSLNKQELHHFKGQFVIFDASLKEERTSSPPELGNSIG